LSFKTFGNFSSRLRSRIVIATVRLRARSVMNAFHAFLAAMAVLLSPCVHAYWEQVPGEASAIAVGANGDVWAIGTIRESGGYGVYRWDGAQFAKAKGIAGVRIAVDPRGFPWVVDSFNNVRRWNGRYWQNLPGWGMDVAIGANGAVWSVGLEGGLHEFRGTRFEKRYPGRFERVGVTPEGEPWPIDEKRELFRPGPNGFESVRSATAAIVIAPEGTAWILDGGGALYSLDATGLWTRREGRFREVAMGPYGQAWALSADNRIFRGMPE
jgi:hypothetical protein